MSTHGTRKSSVAEAVPEFLSLETLEERTPVSEGLSTLTNMAALAAAGRALALAVQPPPSEHLSQFTRSAVVDSKVPRIPGDSSPAAEHGAAASSFRPVSQVPANVPARPIASPLPDPLALEGEGLGAEAIALTDVPTAGQSSHRQPAGLSSDRGTSPLSPLAGTDVGERPSTAPDGGVTDRSGTGSSVDVAPVATNSQVDTATAGLMLGAGLGAGRQPVQVPVGGNVAGGTPGGGDSGGPLVYSRGHGRPANRHGDPLWVLDANNRIVLTDGGTGHDFAGWSVDLYAQVSGATVQTTPPGYNWTYSATDVIQGSVTGQGTYHLHFVWLDFYDYQTPVHSDTISLQTTNTDQSHETWSFTFQVHAHNDSFWSPDSTRPTRAPSFPFVMPPDAVKPGQEMIGQQYYSLAEETGEVRTSFTLPSYDPGITPLQLDYSSLAANPLPIFTEYYQLSLPIQMNSTVTATLTLNGVSYGTSTYDTHLLNPGDILDIALQGNATGLSTGRYSYRIDVTENGTAQPPQTGYVNIVNLSRSPFGAGWSLDNVYQIIPATGGVILALPYGESLWFASTGQYSFAVPAGDFSRLVQNSGDSSYTLTLKNQAVINFNSAGYQTSIVEPTTNNTFTFNYDAINPRQLDSITDYQNRVVTLAYNGSGKVKWIMDPDQVAPQTYRTVTVGYDLHHTQLASLTGPDPGNSETIPSFQYTYDASGDLLTLTDPRGAVFTFAYNFASRIQTVTRPDTLPGGAHTTESLNAQEMNGLVTGGDETATLVVQAVADYSDPRSTPNSNPPNPIDWLTATDWFGYGYGLQYFDPLNDLTTARRDTNGLTWLGEDPLSRATRTFYDQSGSIALPAPQGDATEVVLPDANTELYAYNNYNEVLTYTYADGETATYGYGGTDGTPSIGSLLTDLKCPCNEATSPQPGELQLSYNRRGYQDSFTDPNGHVTSISYSTYGAPASVQYPADVTGGPTPTFTMTYDGAGDRLSYEDALLNTVSYLPDNQGRVLHQTAPTGGQISYSYDAAGNPLSLQDPVQNLTQYQYDAMNRVVKMIAPGTLTTSYTRDADGNVTDIVDPNILGDGQHRDRHLVYDNAGRLITEQWLDGSTVTYQANYRYDAASELISASDQTGGGATISSYTFTYDARGRLASTQENNIPGVGSVTLSVQYNANGNRTFLSDNLNPAATIQYAYDKGNILAVLAMQVARATDFQLVTFTYDTYDPQERLTGIQRSASTTNWADTTYGYTNRNLVKSIQHTYPGASGSVSFSYTYDLDGQVSTYSGPDGGISYAYDSTGQLSTVYGSHPESYTYDLNGNRQMANGHTYGRPGPANELTSDGVYAYTYDNVGNMLTKTGMEGGITTVYSFTWDFQNRLKEVKKTQNGGATVLADDTFTYDVFGRRIGKVDKDGNQVWTVYDGANPYVDFTGTTSLTLATRYLYGPGTDQLLASRDASGNNTVWYLTDLQASVRQVIGDAGSVKATLAYDSFGNIISGTPYNRFMYAGREWDGEVGLYYYRKRYYDPSNGRFISRDPKKLRPGDPNLYRYVANDSVNFRDPSGLDRFWVQEPIQTAKDIWNGIDAWWNTPGSAGAVGGGATGAGIGTVSGAAGAAVVVGGIAFFTCTPIGWAAGIVIGVGAIGGALYGGAIGAIDGAGKTGTDGAGAAATDPGLWGGSFLVGVMVGVRMYGVPPPVFARDGTPVFPSPRVNWPW